MRYLVKLVGFLALAWLAIAGAACAENLSVFYKSSLKRINEIQAELTAGDEGESETMPTLTREDESELAEIERRVRFERMQSPEDGLLDDIENAVKDTREANAKNVAYNDGETTEQTAIKKDPKMLEKWLTSTPNEPESIRSEVLSMHYLNYLGAKYCAENNVGFTAAEVEHYASGLKLFAEDSGLEKSARDQAWRAAEKKMAQFKPMMKQSHCMGTRQDIMSWFPGVFSGSGSENPF